MNNTRSHAVFGLYVAVSVILLWQVIKDLFLYSLGNESCSHIVLIPFVTAYLIYIQRDKIFLVTKSSLVSGLLFVLAGLAFYGVARGNTLGQGQVLSAKALSLILIWAGGFFLCYGNQAARAAAFPLGFLALMVPLPDSVLAWTISLLQSASTELSYLFFTALRVPVLRQGFLLSLPGLTIEVAKECSGIRSSIALFIVCLLAAHLFLRTAWKKFFFVALAFPLAIIKNGIRITTLSMLSIHVDPSFLTGRLHREGGFVFFLLVLGMLAPILLRLQQSECKAKPELAALHSVGS